MRSAFDLSTSSSDDSETAFNLRRSDTLHGPVIFASPHSGTVYPDILRSQLSVPLADLQRTEDAFVDDLYASAVDQGGVLITANYARTFVDLNRDARELDPDMFENGLPRIAGMPSARVKAGLGCLPRVGASGREIYSGQILREEGQYRLDEIHDRYHHAVQSEIERLKADWSDIFLIDCHSMPSRQPGRASLPDIVLGDRFGSSCSARLTSLVERYFRQEGLSVARNAPYAGGYTTRRYGRPRRGVHVLQIELNRALYMHELDVEKSSGFPATEARIAGLIGEILNFAHRENS